MLHFGARPPFTFAKFLEICQDKIPESDAGIIKSLTGGYAPEFSPSALKRWRDFDTALRNELVKIRASRRHVDYLKYIRGDEYIEPYVIHIAMSAHRTPSILEAERLLDRERWLILDELAAGHYFDLDFLISYALKLLILERWERINSADKPRLLEEVLN